MLYKLYYVILCYINYSLIHWYLKVASHALLALQNCFTVKSMNNIVDESVVSSK